MINRFNWLLYSLTQTRNPSVLRKTITAVEKDDIEEISSDLRDAFFNSGNRFSI